MILRDLLASTPIFELSGFRSMDITGISLDPQEVKQGFLFIYDGEKCKLPYEKAVEAAVENGAAAVCIDKDCTVLSHEITFIKTYNIQRFLSAIARNFYHNPSQTLRLAAVTGSHGKSTVGWMVQSILNASGIQGLMMGTSHCQVGNEACLPYGEDLNPIVVNDFLRKALEKDIRWGVIECSYTGIVNELLRHIRFNSIIYTDLYTFFQNQKMDYHYLEIRKTLLDYLKLYNSPIIVNMDDFYANQLIRNTTVTYGIFKRCDVNAYHIELMPNGSRFILITPDHIRQITLKVPGIHNVYNALAAAAWGISEGFSIEDIERGIEGFEYPLDENLDEPMHGQVQVYCDNTCDPERLNRIYRNLQELFNGKVATVLCVSDDSSQEQELLWKTADRFSRYCMLTSDYRGPRGSMDAASELLHSMEHAEVHEEIDQYKALQKAVELVEDGGCVLIISPSADKQEIISAALTKQGDGCEKGD